MPVWKDQVRERSRINSTNLAKREKVLYKMKTARNLSKAWKGGSRSCSGSKNSEQVTVNPDTKCLAILKLEVRASVTGLLELLQRKMKK